MDYETGDIEEAQPFLAEELAQQHEGTPETHGARSTFHSGKASFIMTLHENMIKSLRNRGEIALVALASLAFLLFISFSVTLESRVIMFCLLLSTSFWCLSRALDQLNTEPDNKKKRWIRVTHLRLIFVLVIWMFSVTSIKIKIYLTFIMLADPLAFVLVRIDCMQYSIKLVWKSLITWNHTQTMVLLKLLGFSAIVLWNMNYHSVLAGFLIIVKILGCYFVGLITIASYSSERSSVMQSFFPQAAGETESQSAGEANPQAAGETESQPAGEANPSGTVEEDHLKQDCLGIFGWPFHSGIESLQKIEYFEVKTKVDIELTTTADSSSSVPETGQNLPESDVENQNLPVSHDPESQKSRARKVEQGTTCWKLASWAFTLICALTLAVVLTVLVRSIDDAQSKKLIWLSTAFPSGFFSVALVPFLIITVDFVFDMTLASKERAASLSQICDGFNASLLTAGLCSFIMLISTKFLPVPRKLELYVSILAWFKSELLYYSWELKLGEEYLFSSYMMYMTWYSIIWAIAIGWPFFVTLFTI